MMRRVVQRVVQTEEEGQEETDEHKGVKTEDPDYEMVGIVEVRQL